MADLPARAESAAPLSRTSILLLAAAASIALSLVPGGRYVLYPFELLTTWVHECGHATMTVLIGGSVESVTIAPDTSGLTHSRYPSSIVFGALVSSAGYLGASFVGCALLAATRLRKTARWLLWLLGALMITSLIFWVRNLFGAAVVVVLGSALLLLGRFGRGAWAEGALAFIALQIALNALLDIRTLFLLDAGVHSDAQSMADRFVLPAWLWAGAWMGLSVTMLAATLWWTRERASGSPSTSVGKVKSRGASGMVRSSGGGRIGP
jgi:hypothetical protein